MLPLLEEISQKTECHIKERMKSNREIEVKELMGKVSMDSIASCAFGVDSKSFTNDNSEFVLAAKKILEFAHPWAIVQNVIAMFTPKLVKQFFTKLGFKNFATISHVKENEFFQNVVEASIKHRKESKERRNDLVDLMIDAIEGETEDSLAERHNNSEKITTRSAFSKTSAKKAKDVNYDKVISTAESLLLAGYDTTGTTMTYIIYRLAMNQDCQNTLFEEIENENGAGGLCYETVHSMPYLDAVIHETLRMHPVLAALERPCSKDYKLPNTDLVIKKGDLVRLSSIGISFDPDIFPNPEKWNPDNFSKENRANRNPYSFMAFSLGPRNCLAMRFAFFEMKVAISHIVSKFKILQTEKTCKNVKVDPRSVLGAAKGQLWVRFEER